MTNPNRYSSTQERSAKKGRRACRQAMPIAPEKAITAIPMPDAVPPMLIRKTIVMAMATNVGTVPKKSPETPIRIERVSKTIPCSSSQEASMTITPTIPRTMPTGICRSDALPVRHWTPSRS